MRFYLGYINHLGRLQKKSARLVRQAHQPVRQAGFTITEVLLASLMMVIVISVSGIGVTNLLRSNYRANAGTEIQNNLNRTLEFVSDDVRRAKTIADSETAITSTQVPTGARAVLAFQISDPNNPSQILPHQIVYYTKGPENSLTGPRVLWRYGPNLDPNGNYITPDQIATWQHSPVTDRLAAAASNPNCPTGFTRIPTLGNVDDFYTCVRTGGGQVILNANAQVNLTTGDTDKDKVNYSVSTRVSPRATN
ncbi:MAG: type II secretion system protein [Microcystis panniformis Mp_MB_F_20051200_S9]|uniref:Type II secretion system protein n=1 Tax=Microcystis panniformis Mp_MB_F_20051200_S9 TaxID=2486223 RepID=A0A552PT11_9CHRO|nr:MAG: type II secretion system protein [Microcystis panniformis Mp_GB_SS_20050300_S99]TRV51933.1 MAG: type II secretion system protein [Microcystis panniformis Mp_GB_SS_20050300_S99D]TRV57674.1 MAG: type II secretion system protein [Microcystis panniformis Mp_MB_F_20051200_S9D]TRV60118.1 MAG: type II secretion system protein [Microcystis panniformis Mp_MB_F_20051200_S9]TRV75655.1 MAG: type II secretion system protein [Microcystis panniformis Mp_MB_F_20051200_S6D]TRV76966.1 MAG: type II secre